MIGRMNHVAIAVPDLQQATQRYRDLLGACVSDPCDQPEHGVTTVFIELTNTKIELLAPFGDNSPIEGFLKRNPAGGIHHICLEVDDIELAGNRLSSAGIKVLGDGKTKIGAHGKPVVFIHPKDMFGTLLELEQV